MVSARPLRVVMTVHHEDDPDAGASGVTRDIAQTLAELGHQVRMLSLSSLPGWLPLRARELVFPAYVACWMRLTRYGRRTDVLDCSTGDSWIDSLLPVPRSRVIVVRSHGLEHTVDSQLRAAARGSGPGLAYSIWRGGLLLRLVGLTLVRSDAALVLNAHDADVAVRELGVPAHRVHVVRNGLRRAALQLPTVTGGVGPPTMAFIGAWSARKGAPQLAEILSRVAGRTDGITLRLLGTGLSEDAVRRQLPPGLQRRVTVVARYSRDDLPDLLRGAQVLVMPSQAEGYPIGMLEAMACGLTVVAYDIPGPRDIVQAADVGHLVATGRPDLLADAVADLFGDRTRLERERRRAQAWARTQGWDAIVQGYVHLLGRLTDARGD
jgi:glycosyltransferase involved in cell wall biosynthesis